MEVAAIVQRDADHTGVEHLKNKTRTNIKMALPLPFCALDFEGDVSMNDCLVLGYILPK